MDLPLNVWNKISVVFHLVRGFIIYRKLLFTVGYTLWKLCHIEFIAENRDENFFHQCTEMILNKQFYVFCVLRWDGLSEFTQSIRMNIAQSHVIQQIVPFIRQRLGVPLDVKYAFVTERTGPVCVNLNILLQTLYFIWINYLPEVDHRCFGILSVLEDNLEIDVRT